MQGVRGEEQSHGVRMRARCTLRAIELPQCVLLLPWCHPIAAADIWCPRCAAYLVGRAAPLAEGLRAAQRASAACQLRSVVNRSQAALCHLGAFQRACQASESSRQRCATHSLERSGLHSVLRCEMRRVSSARWACLTQEIVRQGILERLV